MSEPHVDPLTAATVAALDPLGREAVTVLQRLLRFRTVNPPGDEAAAMAWLAGYLREAGLEVEVVGDPARPQVVGRLRGAEPGPVLGFLSHMDTVVADPADWRHDPWSGALDEDCVWGRGALDMKSQTAAEAVALAFLARSGWRPARGEVRLLCVSDEEVDGAGAEWLCSERPDLARCDWLVNEGGGAHFAYDGGRVLDVSTGEKGVFRFTLSTDGVAGHASMPTIADNALPKLAPLLDAMAARRPGWDPTPAPLALLAGLGAAVDGGGGGAGVDAALAAIAGREPVLAAMVEAMLRVTLAPTMVDASRAMNVIPAQARLHVDCRVPPGMEEPEVRARLREVLGEDGYRLDFFERTTGNHSPVETPLMDAIRGWVAATDPEARCLPTISVGYSDSRTFRHHFPDCVAYGFFPHLEQSSVETARLIHSHDERIHVRDLALATACFRDVTLRLLG